jgi:hypothetical protein
LGYPSRTDAVLALRDLGQSDREIARRIGIEPKTVTALAISADRKRRDRTHGRSERIAGNGIVLPLDVQQRLRSAAARRRVSVHRLAIMIVEAVADSDLVDAVLDDSWAGELDA